MFRFLSLATAVLFLGTGQATAQSFFSEIRESYYSLRPPQVELIEQAELSEEEALWGLHNDLDVPAEPSGDISLSQIINLGQQLWAMVEKNKPVVQTNFSYATALPQGVESANQLSRWNLPQARRYKISYKNLFGITVVSFVYRVQYTYGGSLDGKGQYLATVAAAPEELDVAWGFTFEATGKVNRLVNVGTTQDPVAAAELGVDWTVKTPLKESRRSDAFFIQGDGVFQRL